MIAPEWRLESVAERLTSSCLIRGRRSGLAVPLGAGGTGWLSHWEQKERVGGQTRSPACWLETLWRCRPAMVSKDFNHREDNAGTLEMELWYFDAVFRRVGVGKGGRWEDWEKTPELLGVPAGKGRRGLQRSAPASNVLKLNRNRIWRLPREREKVPALLRAGPATGGGMVFDRYHPASCFPGESLE